MEIKVRIIKNSYSDSVALMSLTSKVNQLEGVEEAVVAMGTAMNKELLSNVGMLSDEAAACSENDLIIAIKADDSAAIEAAMQTIEAQFHSSKAKSARGEAPIHTWAAATQELPDANLAIISVPGEYASREARKALQEGKNVLIFSDNMPVEEEKALKEYAAARQLFVMGPDCGTAIINGIGLCFANKVNRGSVGLVAASGTGLQEVTVQLHHLGLGVSQAIGTGGRDLQEAVGGIMMLQGIQALDEDEQTAVIVVISKPPQPSVQQKMLARLAQCSKPAVVCFLDGDAAEIEAAGLLAAPTLMDAALAAARLLRGEVQPAEAGLDASAEQKIREARSRLAAGQSDIRGLFCGGTLTSETLSILRQEGLAVKSNVAKKKHEQLDDAVESANGHMLLDLGDDAFTRGKPHPMIQPSLRNEWILQQARNPGTAAIYLDFVLGYGAHEDPVGSSLATILEAKRIAANEGRSLTFIAYVCGTELDKQNKAQQSKMLQEADVWLARSNREGSLMAAGLAKGL